MLDAFTDSDFRLGGTDVQRLHRRRRTTRFRRARCCALRYLSGSEIDDAPFGVDVLQLDFNTSF